MPCRLCQQDRKLIEAHVIPKSFHRIDPAEKKPSRLVTNVPGRFAQNVPKGIYDRSIVCEECERRFSPWDDYAAELFLQRWSEFQTIEHEGAAIGYQLSEYDYTKLKLFFLSVMWRAAVSCHPMFYCVSLGPHEETLRDLILAGDPGDTQTFAVVLQAFDTTDVGLLNPDSTRLENVRFYRMYVGHVLAWIKASNQPAPAAFTDLVLAPGQPLLLSAKNFLKSKERNIMRTMVMADRNRPKR